MVIRSYFVSNSSSCSFTVPLNDVSFNDLNKLKKFNFDNQTGWSIVAIIQEGYVLFQTGMDNFSVGEWMDKFHELGIPSENVKVF